MGDSIDKTKLVDKEKGVAGTPPLPSALNSLLVVGISYVVTAIAIGWDLAKFQGDLSQGGYWFGFGLAAIGLVFTFTHGFIVGSLGLKIFGQNKGLPQKTIETKDGDVTVAMPVGGCVVYGFVIAWFGWWFLGPTLVMAFITSGFSLAWFFLHLAITPPGHRMLAYIEHGSTSLALLFACMVAASGNWLAMALLLCAQVVMLTVMDRLAHSSRPNSFQQGLTMESVGLRLDRGWRTGFDLAFRLGCIALAVVFIVIHFFVRNEWLATE